MLLSLLSSPRRLKYGGGHPHRRHRDPMGKGWCWKQVAGRCQLWCHPSGTWQQSSTDSHLLPPSFVALLLPIAALTSLLATTRTSLQGEAVPLHESRTQNPQKGSPSSLLEFCHKWPDGNEVRTCNKMEMETMKFYALEQVINCRQPML